MPRGVDGMTEEEADRGVWAVRPLLDGPVARGVRGVWVVRALFEGPEGTGV